MFPAAPTTAIRQSSWQACPENSICFRDCSNRHRLLKATSHLSISNVSLRSPDNALCYRDASKCDVALKVHCAPPAAPSSAIRYCSWQARPENSICYRDASKCDVALKIHCAPPAAPSSAIRHCSWQARLLFLLPHMLCNLHSSCYRFTFSDRGQARLNTTIS